MIQVRKAAERGHFDHGWLNTYHSFSFADYYDPRFSGFRSLLVINEDRVNPGHGFPTHAHNNMEIISYVLAGGLEHKDSMGNTSVIRPGEVQRMSAGTGVRHSEFNHAKEEGLHFLQIWLLPNARGLSPSYEQTFFPAAEKQGRLRLVAAPDGAEGAVTIHQDAKLYSTLLEQGQTVSHQFAPDRYGYVQVVRGSITLNGQQLQTSDGAFITAEGQVTLTGDGEQQAEVLLFDLA